MGTHDTTTRRVALVSGGNRGIGLEICRQLAGHGLHVILGSRDAEQGKSAADALCAKGLSVESQVLDVSAQDTIDALATYIKSTFGGLDVLVNNAGIAMEGFDAEVARKTIDVNFFGALRLTDTLLPLLRSGARIVMVSSGLADVSGLPDPIRSRYMDSKLDRAALTRLMSEFVDEVRAGTHAQKGWPSAAYRISKAGMNALTMLLGRELSADPRGILCNAVCPGWVRTDMGGADATRSVEEGADTPVWLALLPEGGSQGGYFRDRQAISW